MGAPRIDLNLLLVFEAVLRARSTTLAAANLSLTQSAVSNALNRLRSALGDPLFVRTSEGMMPTPRAQEISGPLLQSLERIRETIGHHPPFDPERSDRVFRIYMSDVGQMVMLPGLLDAVRRAAPRVALETVAPVSMRQREMAMSAGEVDLAIGYFEEFVGPFHMQRLFPEEYVCLVRDENPRVGDALSFERYAELDHAVYAPHGGGHRQQESAIEAAFEARRQPRRVMLRTAHFLGFTRLIAAGDMVTALPSRLARVCASMTPVRQFPMPMPVPPFDISQMWHRRYHQDAGNRWLRRLVASLFAGVDSQGRMPAELESPQAETAGRDTEMLLMDVIEVEHPGADSRLS